MRRNNGLRTAVSRCAVRRRQDSTSLGSQWGAGACPLPSCIEEAQMRGTIDKRQGTHGVSYRVRVELPPDPITGKRRPRAETFRTRKEAEKRLSEWLTEIERGTAVDGSKMTVAE